MSLDVYLTSTCKECGHVTKYYSDNITHNLGAMAEIAGIYKELWRPDENFITKAEQLIEPLKKGLQWLTEHESEARKFDAPNGWGLYQHFVPFVQRYLKACEAYPEADVTVSR